MKSVRCSVPDGQDVSRDKICPWTVLLYEALQSRGKGESNDENLLDFHGAKTKRPSSIY
jgi:hypothetical protein